MNRLPPDDVPEAVTTLYLRLNGFLTSGFILHSSKPGEALGDVDCLALWHPHHDQSERGVSPDSFLELGGRPDLLLCEVKSSLPSLSFNERLRTDPAGLNSLIRWSGLVLPSDVPDVVAKLQALIQEDTAPAEARAGFVYSGVRIRALLCCPGCPSEPPVDRWCILGDQMLDYINKCLNPHVPRPSCSPTYSYDLWGGYLEPVVRYFKALASSATPSFAELRARVVEGPPKE